MAGLVSRREPLDCAASKAAWLKVTVERIGSAEVAGHRARDSLRRRHRVLVPRPVPRTPDSGWEGALCLGVVVVRWRYCQAVSTGQTRKASDIRMNMPCIGRFQRNHFSNGILAIASVPTVTPEVGMIMLVKPSPNW